jgi:hypothetical protein
VVAKDRFAPLKIPGGRGTEEVKPRFVCPGAQFGPVLATIPLLHSALRDAKGCLHYLEPAGPLAFTGASLQPGCPHSQVSSILPFAPSQYAPQYLLFLAGGQVHPG